MPGDRLILTPLENPVDARTHLIRERVKAALRDVLTDVFREHLVDQHLVTDPSAACFLAEGIEQVWIGADRDQSARCVTERRSPHPSHRPELCGRRVGNVRVVNPSRRTPRVHAGSPAAG